MPTDALGAGVRRDSATLERVENLEIGGRRLITSDEVLLVSAVKVGPRAQVRFRAGEAVQFGAGFSISEGGSVAVQVIGTNSRSSNRQL